MALGLSVDVILQKEWSHLYRGRVCFDIHHPDCWWKQRIEVIPVLTPGELMHWWRNDLMSGQIRQFWRTVCQVTPNPKKCREDGAAQRWIGLRISLVNRLYVHLLFLELTIAIIILYYYMDCQRHIETTKSTEQGCQITYTHTYNIYIAPYHKISRRITNGLKLHLTLPSYITEK